MTPTRRNPQIGQQILSLAIRFLLTSRWNSSNLQGTFIAALLYGNNGLMRSSSPHTVKATSVEKRPHGFSGLSFPDRVTSQDFTTEETYERTRSSISNTASCSCSSLGLCLGPGCVHSVSASRQPSLGSVYARTRKDVTALRLGGSGASALNKKPSGSVGWESLKAISQKP
jgi:hypothetical protein